MTLMQRVYKYMDIQELLIFIKCKLHLFSSWLLHAFLEDATNVKMTHIQNIQH